MVEYLTGVSRSYGSDSYIVRNASGLGKNIVTHLAEVVYGKVESIVLEQGQVEADIHLSGLLPCNVGVSETGLVVAAGGICTTVGDAEIISIREDTAVTTARAEFSNEQEAATADLVITYDSVGRSELKDLYPIGHVNPGLFVDHPAS